MPPLGLLPMLGGISPTHSTRVHYITVQCSGWCNETSSGKIPCLRLDGKFSVYPDSAASRRRHAADQVGDKSGCFARDEEERVGGEKEEGGRGEHEGPEFQRVL